MSDRPIDFGELQRRAKSVRRFAATWDGVCDSCGETIEQDELIGYIDGELCCSRCCDETDEANA